MNDLFDNEVDRRGTNSVKWEFIQKPDDPTQVQHTDRFFGADRTIPMWVADMDFRCPEPVVNALVERAQHGIYGYTMPTDSFYQSVVNWMRKRHGWEIDPGWICTTPGVVPALHMMVRTFASPGDCVLIQPPVYYPFFEAIEQNGAVRLDNALLYKDGQYRMNWDDLEERAADPRLKMAILCSPHNPVGRVWSEEELVRFGETCLAKNILVVSDEIHGDLIYQGNVFTPFAKISRDFAQHSIICTAPSKTFNMAGLQTSCIIIPNDDLRARFIKTLQSNGLFGVGSFGMVALQAAYDHGEEWLERMLDYLQANLDYLQSYVAEHIPQISVVPPQGTYLVWLDCRRLGLTKSELKRLMMEGARVYLDEGYIFGAEGEGFERINIACPRSILAEALRRIAQAVKGLSNQAR